MLVFWHSAVCAIGVLPNSTIVALVQSIQWHSSDVIFMNFEPVV